MTGSGAGLKTIAIELRTNNKFTSNLYRNNSASIRGSYATFYKEKITNTSVLLTTICSNMLT
jgi:hypothetical protein